MYQKRFDKALDFGYNISRLKIDTESQFHYAVLEERRAMSIFFGI